MAFDKRPHFFTLSHTLSGVAESPVTLEFTQSVTLKSVTKRQKDHAFATTLKGVALKVTILSVS